MSKFRPIRFKAARNARELALQALYKTDIQDSFSGIMWSALLERSELDERERSQATALFYGTLSRRVGLDQCLKQHSKNPLKKLDPLVLNALRLASFQIYFSPQVPVQAAVDTTVELVKRYGHQGMAAYTNAVLRSLLRDLPAFPSTGAAGAGVIEPLYDVINTFLKDEPLLSDAQGIEAYWQKINQVRPLNLRVRSADDIDPVIAELRDEGVSVKKAAWPNGTLEIELSGQALTSLQVWREGRIIVKGKAAQLPALIAAQHRPDKVLDLCAAPGGKSLQLYDLMAGKVAITACDLHAERLSKMQENMLRLGIEDIGLQELDASLFLPKKMEAKYDLVIADVPCSSLGLIDSKPELRFTDEFSSLALLETQAAILRTATSALKVGGVLLYSTCTLNPEENQAQVKRFLIEQAGNFAPLDLIGLPEALLHNPFVKKQVLTTPSMVNLYPHVHESEAFFIAQLQKKK